MKLISKLFKKKFIRNVILISSGTLFAQSITLVLLPIITRLYGPEAYGLLGTFNAIISILVPIAALTLPIAIVLPKSYSEAISILRSSLILICVIFFLSFITILLFDDFIVSIFKLDNISSYIYLIPIVILLSGTHQVLRNWLIRNKEFKTIAKVTVYQSIFTYGGMALAGLIFPITTVLILFATLKSGLGTFTMLKKIRKSEKPISIIISEYSLKFKDVIKKYIDFPKYRAPEVFLNAVSQGLPVLLLALFFGPSFAGFYSLCRSVLAVPTQLIGTAVGDVFYPRIAEAFNNRENITKLLLKSTLSMGVVGIIPFGILMIFSPWIFSFVFGEQWVTAGEYAQWIALWSFFGFLNRPSVKSLPVFNAQRFHLFMSIIMLSSRIAVLVIGFYLIGSDKVTIALLGITGAALNLILILATIKIGNKLNKTYTQKTKEGNVYE